MPDTDVSTIPRQRPGVVDLGRACGVCLGERVVGGLVQGDAVVDQTCPGCSGTGEDPAFDVVGFERPCVECRGSGFQFDTATGRSERCSMCEGAGRR